MRHEDERRVLISTPYKDGETKTIIAKQDCELGNHYHKIKTESFRLIEGSGIAFIGGTAYGMIRGQAMLVQPNDKHWFRLKKDSILFCVCSHPYDKSDDYGY